MIKRWIVFESSRIATVRDLSCVRRGSRIRRVSILRSLFLRLGVCFGECHIAVLVGWARDVGEFPGAPFPRALLVMSLDQQAPQFLDPTRPNCARSSHSCLCLSWRNLQLPRPTHLLLFQRIQRIQPFISFPSSIILFLASHLHTPISTPTTIAPIS